jgi:eukaryotic-like serine/threonine-protein kinase
VRPVRFGKYTLEAFLGKGTLGVVYLATVAEGKDRGRRVALKRIPREGEEEYEELAGRLVDEARIVATLRHPNIVRLLELGRVGEEYFLAVELVEGPTLARLVELSFGRGAPLPAAAALFVAKAIASGLSAAHRRIDPTGEPSPVVHRALAPSNVLITRQGEVKIADFGLARASEKMTKTRAGQLLGGSMYLAPEQATTSLVDARADVFALGSILFELLVGRPLFGGETRDAVVSRLVAGDVPSPSARAPLLPRDLSAILERALACRPEARFSDGGELLDALAGALAASAPGYGPSDLAAVVVGLEASALESASRPGSAPPASRLPSPVPVARPPQPTSATVAAAAVQAEPVTAPRKTLIAFPPPREELARRPTLIMPSRGGGGTAASGEQAGALPPETMILEIPPEEDLRDTPTQITLIEVPVEEAAALPAARPSSSGSSHPPTLTLAAVSAGAPLPVPAPGAPVAAAEPSVTVTDTEAEDGLPAPRTGRAAVLLAVAIVAAGLGAGLLVGALRGRSKASAPLSAQRLAIGRPLRTGPLQVELLAARVERDTKTSERRLALDLAVEDKDPIDAGRFLERIAADPARARPIFWTKWGALATRGQRIVFLLDAAAERRHRLRFLPPGRSSAIELEIEAAVGDPPR